MAARPEEPKEPTSFFKMFGDLLDPENRPQTQAEQVQEGLQETAKRLTASILALWILLVEKGIVNDEVDGAKWSKLQDQLMPAMDQTLKAVQDKKALEYAEENPEEVALLKKMGLWEGPDEPKKEDETDSV